jgi:cold shock protein
MVRAVVREWHEGLGWGVIDSAETPGGCWAHFSTIETPRVASRGGMDVDEYKTLSPRDPVELVWETPGQDGYDFRAVTVRLRPV